MLKGSFFFPADTNVNFRKLQSFFSAVTYHLLPVNCVVRFLLFTAHTTSKSTPLYGMSVPPFYTSNFICFVSLVKLLIYET